VANFCCSLDLDKTYVVNELLCVEFRLSLQLFDGTHLLCTTSPMRMLSKWPWISRCGDYWQQAELRTDGACPNNDDDDDSAAYILSIDRAVSDGHSFLIMSLQGI